MRVKRVAEWETTKGKRHVWLRSKEKKKKYCNLHGTNSNSDKHCFHYFFLIFFFKKRKWQRMTNPCGIFF